MPREQPCTAYARWPKYSRSICQQDITSLPSNPKIVPYWPWQGLTCRHGHSCLQNVINNSAKQLSLQCCDPGRHCSVFLTQQRNMTAEFLTLYVPCIMFQCVDKPTRCNTSYEWSLLFIIWLYMFRIITSSSSGASSHELYNVLVCSCYQASLAVAWIYIPATARLACNALYSLWDDAPDDGLVTVRNM